MDMSRQDSAEYELGFLILLSLTSIAVAAGVFKRKRKYKVRPMNRRRHKYNVYEKLVKFAEKHDVDQFFKYTRMTPEMFKNLLHLLEPHLQKDKKKNPIIPGHRLAITLHYLSEGCSMQEIAWNNYIGKTTVHCIIKETCAAIWNVLTPLVLPPPTEEDLKRIAAENFKRWNMPNCIGSVDVKHVEIQCPKHSGSTYFSYKKSFSIVLMAACDAYYKLTYVDIGSAGSNHDSTVFKESSYGRALLNGSLPIPQPSPLPGTEAPFPYFFAADAAFPLHANIMRPYPGSYLDDRKSIFNMRLSRVRRTIENTFGILVQRWRRLRSPIIASEDMCESIVMAIVALHNYVQKGEEDMPVQQRKYCPTGFVDWEDDMGVLNRGRWRDIGRRLTPIGRLGSNNPARTVTAIREHLADWLLSPFGAIQHQWEQLHRDGVPDRFRRNFNR